MLRIGVIGAGANTRKMHLPGFQKIPGVKVTVVCNRSKESSEKVAKEFGIPKIVDRWEQAIESPDVDAVMIGTWPYLHVPATIAALEAGKHVLTEARMAPDLAGARRMFEAGRRRPDLVTQIVPAPMSLDVDSTVADLLEEERLGKLREVCVTHTAGQYFDGSKPIAWRQDLELSGLNILSMGIYHEMAQRWLDFDPEWIIAAGEVFTKSRPAASGNGPAEVKIPDSISILGGIGPARMIYHFSGVETASPRNEIRINGSRGCLRFDAANGELFLSEGGETEQRIEIPPEKKRGWRVEADFVASIREGMPVRLTSFEDGVRYMRFTEAVYRSRIEENRKVFLSDL